jgi:uracil-DNA glycosylase
METPIARFPFGSVLRPVVQTDTSPKNVFVLGVYASAVHARWLGPDGKTRVKALAVASEPYIFWRGDDAEAVINAIDIPSQAGRLVPAAANLNGPSGVALDERFLVPLGLSRGDAWLSDLVPHSCLNPSQAKALAREYEPISARLELPKVSLPSVPKRLADEARQNEIAEELLTSQATLLVLLGDHPIRWFLRRWNPAFKALSDFGTTFESYGRPRRCNVMGREIDVLALVHPRQAARLGASSAEWSALHAEWSDKIAPSLLH